MSTSISPLPVHQAAEIGFGSETSTATYERGRPSYDTQAIDALITKALARRHKNNTDQTPDVIRVLDIGAGTGKSTRVLKERLHYYETMYGVQCQLTAVEPVEGMRKRFLSVTPGVSCIAGSADHLPSINDNSIDIIFACQAFHWFSTPQTLTEWHRVLRVGGCIALIWNTRNRDTFWVGELESLIDTYYPPDVPRQQSGQFKLVFQQPPFNRYFSPLAEQHYTNAVVQTGDMNMMLDRVMSISVIAALQGEERAAFEQKVKDIIQSHPDHQNTAQYSLPYKTEVYWSYKVE